HGTATLKGLHMGHRVPIVLNPFRVHGRVRTVTQGAPLRDDPGLWRSTPLALLKRLALMLLTIGATSTASAAPPKAAAEDDFYRTAPTPTPAGITLEVGGLAFMPDAGKVAAPDAKQGTASFHGKLAVSTRHGDIYTVDNPLSDLPENTHFTKFAEGLHEVL